MAAHHQRRQVRSAAYVQRGNAVGKKQRSGRLNVGVRTEARGGNRQGVKRRTERGPRELLLHRPRQRGVESEHFGGAGRCCAVVPPATRLSRRAAATWHKFVWQGGNSTNGANICYDLRFISTYEHMVSRCMSSYIFCQVHYGAGKTRERRTQSAAAGSGADLFEAAAN